MDLLSRAPYSCLSTTTALRKLLRLAALLQRLSVLFFSSPASGGTIVCWCGGLERVVNSDGGW